MTRENPMLFIEPEAILETPRLLLEPLQISHALVLYEPLQSVAIYEYIPVNPPVSLEALANRYQWLSSRRSPDEQEVWLNWAMRERRENRYVGTLEATVYPDATASLAYILFPIFWRQGTPRKDVGGSWISCLRSTRSTRSQPRSIRETRHPSN